MSYNVPKGVKNIYGMYRSIFDEHHVPVSMLLSFFIQFLSWVGPPEIFLDPQAWNPGYATGIHKGIGVHTGSGIGIGYGRGIHKGI